MRAAAYLSGMLTRPRARRSAPPSFTTSIARSNMCSSVPLGTPTTATPPSSAMRTSTLSSSEISSAVGACPFGGSATVLVGLTKMSMSSSSHRRKTKAPTVLAVTPIKPREREIVPRPCTRRLPLLLPQTHLCSGPAPVATPGKTLPDPWGPLAGHRCSR